MFKGQESIAFTTSTPQEAISSTIEESLQRFGKVSVSKKGAIEIEPRSKYKTALTDSNFEGTLEQSKKNPQQWVLTIAFSVKPTVVCWITAVIGMMAAGLGFLVLLVPFKAKGAVQQAVIKALHGVQDEFE